MESNSDLIIKQLKRRIAIGDYSVDADAVARAIISRLVHDPPDYLLPPSLRHLSDAGAHGAR